METPLSMRRSRRRKHFCVKNTSPTASASSMSRTSASTLVVPAKARRTSRLLDELADIGKRDDLVEALVGLLSRQAENRRVQIDVLASRVLGVESASQL